MRRFAGLVLLSALALAGCASATDAEEQRSVESTGTSTGQSAPAATADAELDAFRAALQGHGPADPEALLAAIEDAGFDRSAIERTRELDSLGAPVTFMEVAVRVDDGCLVGQVGDGEPMAIRAEAFGGERCLVGDVVGLD